MQLVSVYVCGAMLDDVSESAATHWIHHVALPTTECIQWRSVGLAKGRGHMTQFVRA